MATAHQIRDLIAQTTTCTTLLRVPREVRDEVCRYAGLRDGFSGPQQGSRWVAFPKRSPFHPGL